MITEDVNGLTGGNYTVTVTDSLGCTSTQNFSILQHAAAMTVESTVHPVTCFGDSSGSVSVTISGGISPFSYVWSTGSTASFLHSLPEGFYSVTITGQDGCTTTSAFEIEAPDSALTAVASVTQLVSCYGDSTGALQVITQGGTPGYQFLWSTGSISSSISGLTAGTYTVTVTDANGCFENSSIQIDSPPALLQANGMITHEDCINGITGSVQVGVTGGSPAYLYNWSNGSTGNQATGLTAGLYSVTVTDMSGCVREFNYVVENRSEVHLLTPGEVSVCIGEMGQLYADSTLTNVQVQWFYNGTILNGATGFELNTPAAGLYHVVVSASCGTFASDTVRLIVRSVTNAAVSSGQIICPPETARLYSSGGVEYKWLPVEGLDNPLIQDPVASPERTTVYSVEIRDSYGCRITLPVPVTIDCDSLFIPNGFSPNSDGINDGYVVDGIEHYPDNKLWVYNRWGALVYKTKGYLNKWDGVSNISGAGNGTKLDQGTYFFILDLGDGSRPKSGYLILRH
jgi:gliding motility-associated-like protein